VSDPTNPLADPATTARVPTLRLRWKATFRLVASRHPPIDLFERIADPADWELLYELEAMTNPRLRQETGQISLVPPSRRVSGPGASIVMAPFTHVSTSRPTRFSNGAYGVYYAGRKFETALHEVAYHMGRFYAATADPPHEENFRTYKGRIDKAMHDLRSGDWSQFLNPDPEQYGRPQELGRRLRESSSNGIVYPSVRHAGGECIAAFWPDVLSIPIPAKRIALRWNGKTISGWFDYGSDAWSNL
jgi:hypothetical protein